MSTSNEIINEILKESKGQYGIFCINCIFMHSSFKDLKKLANEHNIVIAADSKTKMDFLRDFAIHFYVQYKNNEDIENQYESSLDYMGNTLLSYPEINQHLSKFDFIAKQELIDVFSDFCADLGISIFDTSNIVEYSLDLYLTKKTPLLRTEAVFVRTAVELDQENYDATLKLIQNAKMVSTWTVFVTTPAGVYKLGMEKLIKDMENLDTWLYVVNPQHKKILGISKGKKSKSYDTDLRDIYIQKLPREPVRAPSQVIKFSKYEFNEDESYKPKSFFMFELLPEQEFERIMESTAEEKAKYQNIFRNLIVIDIESGISIFSYSGQKSIDENLISGFLTAMDQFVSEFGGEDASMKEIDYKGFYVQAAYGDYVKIALFLSQPSDKILKERLDYFIKQFENNYTLQIKEFRETGSVNMFDRKKLIDSAKNLLKI
ncbi:MAG: hypothetical protein GF383_04225 [Candidatus Lokiarchaeota archaeon]|nr:hypothetical protein [Candidatus Lokiarchaeota archaeon]MBD3338961.1 hypothetical protein [Candidatus Lokiarchaeota archaeon]